MTDTPPEFTVFLDQYHASNLVAIIVAALAMCLVLAIAEIIAEEAKK